MNFIKIAHNHSFTTMRMKILCIIRVSFDNITQHTWDLYIHLHTIFLIGVTELGTVTFHFARSRRRFYRSLRRKLFFELKFICAEFQIFSSFKKYITILVSILTEIGL